MSDARTRRGRPKGTGIDDSDRIARIAALLKSHPELKPTTAIRLMGFSDPSAIRRLRDKYKALLLMGHGQLVPEFLSGTKDQGPRTEAMA